MKTNYDIFNFLAQKALSGKYEDVTGVVDMLTEITVSDLFNYGYYPDSDITKAIYYLIYRWLSKQIWGKCFDPGKRPLLPVLVTSIDKEYLASKMALRVHYTVMELIRKDRDSKKPVISKAKESMGKQKAISSDVVGDRNVFTVDVNDAEKKALINEICEMYNVKDVEELINEAKANDFLEEVNDYIKYVYEQTLWESCLEHKKNAVIRKSFSQKTAVAG